MPTNKVGIFVSILYIPHQLFKNAGLFKLTTEIVCLFSKY
ncbi:hypothetical protein AN392_00748 [Pseudoalteromonas sp. P1-16-1b]|nr:hypothetical protein AN392_00748 [Pseudoalteromonas sp. P1-16-1b]